MTNLFVQWDNFDLMEKVPDQVMGVVPKQRSVTTGRVYVSPHFDCLLQSQVRWSQPLRAFDVFTSPGISFDDIQRDLVRAHISETIFRLFDNTHLGYAFPVVERLDVVDTPSHVLGAIFANEGTIDGTYDVHDQVFLQHLGFDRDDPVFDERLIPLIGDQKTANLSRVITQDSEESAHPYDRKRWLLSISALFHWRQNRLWSLQSIYAGSIGGKSQATLSSHMSFWRLLQVPLQKAPFHQVEKLVLRSWDARLLAILYRHVGTSGVDTTSPSAVRSHLRAVGRDGIRHYIERLVVDVFEPTAYAGRSDDVDMEYLAHVRFLNDVVPYKTMAYAIRRADIGLIERALNSSIILCAGTNAHNYTNEMLTFRWLCSTAGDASLRRAILASGLVNLSGREDSWIEVDYHGELLNGRLKINLYDRRSSTYTLDLALRRTALTLDYASKLRDVIEKMADVDIYTSHTSRTAFEQIHELAYDLSRSSTRPLSRARDDGFTAPDTQSLGADAVLAAIASFNDNRLSTGRVVREDGIDADESDKPMGGAPGDQVLTLDGDGVTDMFIDNDESGALDNVDDSQAVE